VQDGLEAHSFGRLSTQNERSRVHSTAATNAQPHTASAVAPVRFQDSTLPTITMDGRLVAGNAISNAR